MIRSVRLEDAKEIAEIYNYYILNSVVTFEETPVGAEEIEQRIRSIIARFPWIIYEVNGRIIGYAFASEWKSRCAYNHSVESTIYLKQGEENKGIGSVLYQELVEQLREMDLHAIIGGIALPNDASVCLHEKFGFEKVAHFKEVGFKFGNWIDVGYWELIFR